jgi:tellurite resistance protein TerC
MDANQIVMVVFALVVSCLLMLDIRSLFKDKPSAARTKNAVIWTLIWISTSMLFSAFIWFENGFERFSQFQSAYWIEQSLSVDNLFVFLMVFGFFGINGPSQHKILLWGILGAMVLRGIFIFAGTWLIKLTYLPPFWIFNQDPHIPRAPGSFHQINVLITFFGFMLLYAAIKTWWTSEEEDKVDYNKSFVVKILRKYFNVLTKDSSDKFWIRRNGTLFFTRLFMVLVIIETTDLLFAIDSIPAIFSIAPEDPFILYTSNIFAIFSLRSLYFLLANSLDRFSTLKYGIGIILGFIGIKMIIAPWMHIETVVSLSVIVLSLTLSIAASWWSTKTTEKH